jgi:hypothetical protein
MKLITRSLLALLVVSVSIGYSQDSNSDNHTVSIVIPQISLLDIEPEGANDITITMTVPAEAGDPFASETDNSLWLNVTSIVASLQTRDISVSINAAIPGLNLKVVSAAYSGSGFGSWGTVGSELTLSTSSQNLITGIGSGYTGDGANNGYQLTYTAEPDASNFANIESTSSTNITVTYTMTP